MPQIKSPILGSAYTSRSLTLSCQRMVNLFLELVETKDGKEPGALYGCPGLNLRLEHEKKQWRALMSSVKGQLYGVVGDQFLQITSINTFIQLGTLITKKGQVVMAEGTNQMLLTDGHKAYGYSMDTNEFRQINLPFVAGDPIVCAYQDGFFVLNQSGSTQWWQSEPNDVFTWNALNFASKEGQPDPIIAMVEHHREIWLFGNRTTEVWVNQGNPGFTFGRLEGVFFQVGCAATFSAVCCEKSVIWLAQSVDGTGVAMMVEGYQDRRISTHAIERQWQSYPTIRDAIAYSYQQEGHRFYVLTFPSGDATWVYDLNTGLWHERASFSNGHFHRHRSNCCAAHMGKIVVGDFEDGRLYELDLDTYDDAGEKRKWLRSFQAQPTGQINLNRNFHLRAQLYMQPAVGRLNCGEPIRVLADSDDNWRTLQTISNIRVLSGQVDENCEDPQIMLRSSDDGGLSWGSEKWRSPGKIGETKHRVKWDCLGSSRDRIYEVSATDPFKVSLLGFFIDIEQGLD